jgi:hypothetical protein
MVCATCKEEKDLDEFHAGARVCKGCKKDADARSFQKHREARLEKRRQDRLAAREWFESLKAGKKCADCDLDHPPWRMDWDHLPGTEKLFEIADVSHMATGEKGKRKILDEIAKCELVCANCHRDRTHDRRRGVAL